MPVPPSMLGPGGVQLILTCRLSISDYDWLFRYGPIVNWQSPILNLDLSLAHLAEGRYNDAFLKS